MFLKCSNTCCPRAGWCKRVTYKPSSEPYKEVFMECSDEDGWANYKQNKAREIYERDYPERRYNDRVYIPSSEQEEHARSDREPGMRQDNVSGEETQRNVAVGYYDFENWLRELLGGSDTGSNVEGNQGTPIRPEALDLLQDFARTVVPPAGSVSEEPDA